MLSAMICALTSSKSGDRGATIVVDATHDIKKGIYGPRPLGAPGGMKQVGAQAKRRRNWNTDWCRRRFLTPNTRWWSNG